MSEHFYSIKIVYNQELAIKGKMSQIRLNKKTIIVIIPTCDFLFTISSINSQVESNHNHIIVISGSGSEKL